MPAHDLSVLSISASDTLGESGLQADVRTVSALGGHALTAVTAVSMAGDLGTPRVHSLPTALVAVQVQSALSAAPGAVKVGLMCDPETIAAVGGLLQTASVPPVVLSPGILASNGRRIAGDAAAAALCRHLLPAATLAVLRCGEAELLLGLPIASDDDMLSAAQDLRAMGPQWVMLRGGLQTEGRCTALLCGPRHSQFFASYNIEGWRQHGVGGALSAAIAARLAAGDSVPAAVSTAHDYVRSQVVYAVRPDGRRLRPADLCNQFLSLVAQHYAAAHDVAFYAGRLAISPRYLAQMTHKQLGKTPKAVLADHLLREAKILLETSRLTVSDIARRLGFPDSAAFCKFFVRHAGKSPSEWRQPSIENPNPLP